MLGFTHKLWDYDNVMYLRLNALFIARMGTYFNGIIVCIWYCYEKSIILLSRG